MDDKKKVEGADPTGSADCDQDAVAFEALIRDIAELKDGDTEVEHMAVDAYRKGKRS